VSKESLWQRSDQFVGTQLDKSFVLLSLEGARYFAFNASANDVWQLLERPQSVEEIMLALMQKYDVSPDVCAQSVTRVMSELQANGLVYPVP